LKEFVFETGQFVEIDGLALCPGQAGLMFGLRNLRVSIIHFGGL